MTAVDVRRRRERGPPDERLRQQVSSGLRTLASLVDCKPGEADQQWMLSVHSSGEGFQIRNMTRGVCLTTDATLGACTTDSAWRMTPNLTAIPGPHVRIPTPGAE